MAHAQKFEKRKMSVSRFYCHICQSEYHFQSRYARHLRRSKRMEALLRMQKEAEEDNGEHNGQANIGAE